jgi:hypothetical protein
MHCVYTRVQGEEREGKEEGEDERCLGERSVIEHALLTCHTEAFAAWVAYLAVRRHPEDLEVVLVDLEGGGGGGIGEHKYGSPMGEGTGGGGDRGGKSLTLAP